MAVAYDSGSVVNRAAANNSDSWSHTCAGSDRYVIVALANYVVGGTSVTYDGVSMNNLGNAENLNFGSSIDARVTLFGLANPPTGAKTVSVTYSGSGSSPGGWASSASFTGVHQSASVGTIFTQSLDSSYTGSNLTVTDGVTDDLIIAFLLTDAGASGVATVGDTSLRSTAEGGYDVAFSYAPGAASVEMDFSWPSSTSFCEAAIALKQTSAGGTAALSGSAVTPNAGTAPPGISVGI
jgi:hypothetical protein